MEHNLFMQAIDKDNNMHTYEYYTILSYLIDMNHVCTDEKYKLHKAVIYGKELKNEPDGNIGVTYFRDIWDFKIFCRRHCERKEIKTDVPQNILDKFLLSEPESKRDRNYKAIQKGANNLNSEYNNGGGGNCEYRPGYIEGYSFFKAQGVEIQWINNDGDICIGIVPRTRIFTEIKALISKGEYLHGKNETKPKIVFYNDGKQLQGQLSLFDWMTG
jgi:hypothetical protein